ncbi:MAG: LON peptidase substrate-binding domain-containing protein [Acidimicrobiia bacterium]
MAVLPMFPLGTVLLPGAVLPLHVFEPRYRRLVQDLLAGEPEFGVALIDRGSEVGGGDQRSRVGTVARLIQVAELEDGRYAVLSVGTRRVKVTAWLPDDPYPLAEIDDWPDEEVVVGDASDLVAEVAAVHQEVRRVVALAVELGDMSADPAEEIADDPVLASYHLSALAPLGPADRQRLLCAPGPAARLALLTELLSDVEAAMQFRLFGGRDESTGTSSPP